MPKNVTKIVHVVVNAGRSAIPLNLVFCLLITILLGNLSNLMAEVTKSDSQQWWISPFVNMGYQATSNGTGSVNFRSSSKITKIIAEFDYRGLKFGIGLAIASQKYRMGLFSELRLLLGLANPGKYTISNFDSGDIFISDNIGLGMALGPYFYFPLNKLSLGLAPYLALGYIPTENSADLSAISSITVGIKFDMFINSFGLNAGFELGAAMASVGGYVDASYKVEYNGKMSALQVGFYGGVSVLF